MSKWVKIAFQVSVLYGLYLIGLWIKECFHLSLPGGVIGMLILFVLLHIPFLSRWVGDGSMFLVKVLPILFIPATVGIMNYFSLFSPKGLVTIFIVIGSTAMVMVSSGWISQKMIQRKEAKKTIDNKEHSL